MTVENYAIKNKDGRFYKGKGLWGFPASYESANKVPMLFSTEGQARATITRGALSARVVLVKVSVEEVGK